MIANSRNIDSAVSSDPRQACSDNWHLWRVIVPRRLIAGRLVWGTVWRTLGIQEIRRVFG